MDVIPLDALFVEGSEESLRPEARLAIARADVVIAVDLASQDAFTVFGTPALEESVQLGKQVALRTVRIGLSAKTGELEKLVAVVRAIKRGQDYVGE